MTIEKVQAAEAARPRKPKEVFVGQSTEGAAQASVREGDFVASVLDLLASKGLLLEDNRTEADAALRGHFGCDRYYVAAKKREKSSADLARTVLARFNGRNAREIARELRIGKTTVYRIIKQAGSR